MPSQEQWTGPLFGINLPLEVATPVLVLVFATMSIAVPSAQAQTFTVLHTFTGGLDGANPHNGLTMDHAGNLYGTTRGAGSGSNHPYGSVFKLTPSNGGTFTTLYSFETNQGIIGNLAMVAAGSLYGTVYSGVPEVFRLTQSNGEWALTGAWGGAGASPSGNVIFDSSGNLYTTAQSGGPNEVGVVFEITP
jgi:hypothetical protein